MNPSALVMNKDRLGANKDRLIRELKYDKRMLRRQLSHQSKVMAIHSHRDRVFASQLFKTGGFDDSIVPGHTMYSVEVSGSNMKLNDLSLTEIHLCGCEFMSHHDASQIAMWLDSSSQLLRIMLGSRSRQIVLNIAPVNWHSNELDQIRIRVKESIGSQVPYQKVLSNLRILFRTLVFEDDAYKGKEIQIKKISFRVRPVRKLIELHGIESFDRGKDGCGSPVRKDFPSFLFDRNLAKMLGCVLPDDQSQL